MTSLQQMKKSNHKSVKFDDFIAFKKAKNNKIEKILFLIENLFIINTIKTKNIITPNNPNSKNVSSKTL